MRLYFRVLWVDDQPEQVDPFKFAIEPAITEEGFKFDVVKARSHDEAMNYISADGVIIDNIDLVLIDYHLDNGVDGDIVAREIRKKVPFKDIIFYSSDPVVELQRKIFDQHVEGIYCANRDELVPKVRGLFRDIVRKVLDLEHMRGIVMGATSDNEHLVTEAIASFDAKLADDHRTALVVLASERLQKGAEDLNGIREKLLAKKSLKLLMKSFQFSAAHRLDLAIKILELLSAEEHQSLRESLKRYREETMPGRNKMGHTRIHVSGSLSELRSGATTYNVEELRQLRKDLVEHSEHFEQLWKLANSDHSSDDNA